MAENLSRAICFESMPKPERSFMKIKVAQASSCGTCIMQAKGLPDLYENTSRSS
jgi:hypothetical protein